MPKILSFLIILIFIWAFFIEPHLLVVKHYQVDSLKGIRIVFASDFHISKFDRGRLRRVVKLINEQNPDIVIFGGDFIKGHDGKNTLAIEEQTKIFKAINSPVVTVLGNHDGWYDREKVARVLNESGIKVLENSNTKLKGIYISGLEDLQTGYPDINKALDGTASPGILVTHSPDVYYDVKEKVDLILAGHTHGGQVSFPIIGAPVVPSEYGAKFARRVIKETDNLMIITKGIGTSILPIRFGSIPEIVVIN